MIRINISLSEQTHEEFKQLADEHYSGNVSRLIRAAVHDHHKRTLEEQEQLTLEILQTEVSEMNELLRTISEEFDEMQQSSPEATTDQDGELSETAEKIQAYILETSGAVTQSKLFREMELTPMEIREGIATLLDWRVITEDTSEEDPRYLSTSITASTSEEHPRHQSTATTGGDN
ncbi:ribbon-helix-helix domain-containing protein [Halosegnis longus]|uniref:hypothetical protein n=1 Tax=Halosegnis longus TaxID=2216012 RepID=UPI00096AC8C4|nr:hypothetical protein [Salella cibi]